jgi:hypothetical protein
LLARGGGEVGEPLGDGLGLGEELGVGLGVADGFFVSEVLGAGVGVDDWLGLGLMLAVLLGPALALEEPALGLVLAVSLGLAVAVLLGLELGDLVGVLLGARLGLLAGDDVLLPVPLVLGLGLTDTGDIRAGSPAGEPAAVRRMAFFGTEEHAVLTIGCAL